MWQWRERNNGGGRIQDVLSTRFFVWHLILTTTMNGLVKDRSSNVGSQQWQSGLGWPSHSVPRADTGRQRAPLGHLPRWVTPSKNGAYRKPYRLVLKSTRAHDQVWFCAQCSLVCVCIRNSKQKEGLPFLKIKIVLSLLTEIPYLQYLVVPTFCWRIRNLSRCSRCSVSICWAN